MMTNLVESTGKLTKVKEELYDGLDLSSVNFNTKDKLRQLTLVNWQAIVNLIQQPYRSSK